MNSSEILLSLNEKLEVKSNSFGKIIVRYHNSLVRVLPWHMNMAGYGKDFEEACDDYLSKIKGERLVFDIHTENEREALILC